jgi:AcrR family transcriptional regulator
MSRTTPRTPAAARPTRTERSFGADFDRRQTEHAAPAAQDQGPVRRASPKGVARRSAILSSATRLFAAGGFNNVSLAEIAADVGMTQAGLLHHFPSKADLVLSVLIERETKSKELSREKRRAGLDPLTVFLQTLQIHDRTPALVQLMAFLSAESIAGDHPAHEWFRNRYVVIADELTGFLQPMVDATALPDGVTAETIARWIIGLADGLRIQWLHDQRSVDRGASIARFYDLLRPYLVEPYRSMSWTGPDRGPAGR